jgi:hypothetical protein
MTARAEQFDVAVPGGSLQVGRWGTTGPTVLALHGITAKHMAWLEVARNLPGVTLLAPDLRGRGRSADLPGPFGLGAHVADIVALLEAVGSERVVSRVTPWAASWRWRCRPATPTRCPVWCSSTVVCPLGGPRIRCLLAVSTPRRVRLPRGWR